MKSFSFIVISFNRPLETIEAVKSILSLNGFSSLVEEVIVLNNGSNSSYLPFTQFLAELHPLESSKVDYIDSKENLGVSGGRNLCMKRAKGEILFFLDDDAEIPEANALSIVISKFENPEIEKLGILGFQAINPVTGNFETPLKRQFQIDSKVDEFNNSFYGYGHAILRSMLAETGMYEEDFFYGMEEYDLSLSAISAGYSILITKDFNIIHKANPQGREVKDVTYRRMFENRMIAVYKHLPLIYVISQFLFWSAHLLVKSRFNLKLYIQAYTSFKSRSLLISRKVISKERLRYFKKVKARLWY